MDIDFAEAIDRFILYLATERGLSENYQLSTRRSLEDFADWASNQKQPLSPDKIELAELTEYLASEKERGLAPASMKLIVVALKIFFRFLKMRSMTEKDPAELLTLPRLTRFLPETLNQVQVNRLLGGQHPGPAVSIERSRNSRVVLCVGAADQRTDRRTP